MAGMTWVFGLQVSDFVIPAGFWAHKLIHDVGFHTMGIAMFYFALVFPQVHPVVWKHPTRLFLLILSPSLLYLAYGLITRLTASSTLSWLGGWFTMDGPFNLLRFILIVGATIVNYRMARTNMVARQQIRWVIFGLIALALTIGILWIMPLWLLGRPLLPSNLISIVVLFLPISLAIAILKYHLFDIDLILSRTLTYSFLTLIIVAFYVGSVVGVTWLFNTERGNLFTSLAVTGVVAILFQPLRDRLQQWANQVVYGERDLPYQILARLASRLEKIEATEAILPAIVETVAHTLRLPSVALAVRDEEQFHIAAVYPLPRIHDFSANIGHRQHHVKLPIVYQSELIGQLILDPPAIGESFSETDIRLLEDIARQAGPAVYSVRLTTDLQHSRERLITAREEERRRIRRDLHDGLGPQLASQMLTLDAVLRLLERDPAAAARLLHDLKTQARDALTSIRELVYDLRPPALDELGLVGALQERVLQSRQMGTEVKIDTPDGIPPLSAAVEVAVYRIVQEAVTNVIRHAKASHCQVLLRPCDDGYRRGLMLEVKDNGSGLPDSFHQGIGMVSMRERADELGGSCTIESISGDGVTINVWLPLLEVEDD
jgi:signal transduction histidine kinase